jgi:branched-chain amino acid transport system permease protein
LWELQAEQGIGLAVVVVSVVPLTGYLGQISLMQWGVAGAGAFLSGALAADSGLPMLLALLLAGIIAFGMGTVIALPMLRIRGIDVAIVTLGAGIAIQQLLLGTYWGRTGITVPRPDLLGVTLSTRQFLYVSEVILGLVVLVTFLLRRGAFGQHLLAARASERAAAACGLRTAQLKLWTFGMSCAIAAIGGGLYGFATALLNTETFDPLTSTQILAFAFIGGVGSLTGAVIVGLSLALGPLFLNTTLHVRGASWFDILGGIGVLLTIIWRPDGAFVRMPSDWPARARRRVAWRDEADAMVQPNGLRR